MIAINKKIRYIKTQSPDVETPGLLVKALISSYFMIEVARTTRSFYFCATNIIECINILHTMNWVFFLG